MTISIKNPQEIEKMRVAGKLAAEVLDYLTPHVLPGVTTGRLDELAHRYMVDVQGTIPAPLNYNPSGTKPYPKSICTSVNHQVCHGIPGERHLKRGDIVNIDVTVIKDGWHGDTSRMFMVGGETGASIAARRLCQVTFDAMWQGITQIRNGQPLYAVGAAIEKHAQQFHLSVVRDYCGHGIGRGFHEDPQVLHYGLQRRDRLPDEVTLKTGMIITVEPMLNIGQAPTRLLSDGWTVVTRDHTLSAQWEHTVLVTESGFEVLTESAASPRPPPFVSAKAN